MNAALISIIRISTLLLAAGAVLSVVLADADFALGMVATGALTLLSLGLSVLGTRSMVTGGVRPSALLLGLKLPMICLGVWVLIGHFPPLSIALGGIALVLGAAIHASASLFAPAPVRRV